MNTFQHIKRLLLTALLAANCSADQLCFSYAENYYEQLYCEISAKGQGKNLPSFYDFRRNNEQMQALLLKPFARRININVLMPKASTTKTSRANARAVPKIFSPQDPLSQCQLNGAQILCSSKSYRFVGNQPNSKLQANALDDSNKMSIPTYKKPIGDVSALNHYLVTSYEHYLIKMQDIGLGGSILSYGKFEFLFNDLRLKGVNFSDRFEKMFYYLKRDKQQLSVPIKPAPPSSLTLKDCYRLESLMVCSLGAKNYLFVPS